MTKSLLAIAAVFAVLTIGSAAALAQQNPYTKAPPPVPASIHHQQATLSQDPDACAKAVETAADNIGLRIQGDDGKNGRMQMNTFYQAARNAAAAGNNEGCWHWYDRAMNAR